VAKSDFFYITGQRATMHYANVLPQWQNFNSGNWQAVEDKVRAFAWHYGRDLEVYTGGYGRASLPNNQNVQTNLYLMHLMNNDKKMPVPRYFWKIVYDPIAKAGIAIIGLNNPYQEVNEIDFNDLCADISTEVNWLKIQDASDMKLGYIRICEINSFRAKFLNIPDFTVNSVLK
jgi:DNA/RNA endonuclease G (NUC1)